MFIHSKLGYSTVNGPGERAVVWLQGCVGMNCHGCWNPETHKLFQGESWLPGELARWIAEQPVTGVTFSGGEPMHQASGLLVTLDRLRKLRPDFSLGLFTGYTEKELESAAYQTYIGASQSSVTTVYLKTGLWERLRDRLDFAIMGRYNWLQPANGNLCSSKNQQLRLFTSRHTEADFARPLEVEVTITDELIQVTGFPTRGVQL